MTVNLFHNRYVFTKNPATDYKTYWDIPPHPSFGLHNSDSPCLYQFRFCSDTPGRLKKNAPDSTYWQVRKMECPMEAKEPNQCTDRISFDTCHLLLENSPKKIRTLVRNRVSITSTSCWHNDDANKENLHFDNQSQHVFLFFIALFSNRNRKHVLRVSIEL